MKTVAVIVSLCLMVSSKESSDFVKVSHYSYPMVLNFCSMIPAGMKCYLWYKVTSQVSSYEASFENSVGTHRC
jgi:hypothetical protein